MAFGHIKIKSDSGFNSFAQHLKELLNVAGQNRSAWQKEQERYGLNIGGGEYYLFELLGLEIYLIKNKGEVQYFDAEWPYYLSIKFEQEIKPDIFNGLLDYINTWLKSEGYITEIERSPV